MLFLYLLFSVSIAQVVTNNFNVPFTSAKDSYRVQKMPSQDNFRNLNELFNRNKCSTCCRVMFVSDYNFDKGRQFTLEDDRNNDTRYVMDMEFDDISGVRAAEGNYEQTILLRPINKENSLQYFELNAYKMINMFDVPGRVHDIRSGISIGNKLIIWSKKEPLLESTNNQRFVYTYPYQSSYLNGLPEVYKKYQKHFHAPYYTNNDVCYEAVTNGKQTWTGNKHLTVKGKSYQIKINECSDKAEQFFIPIFA